MSSAVANFYWDQYAGVKGGERLVILALAHYCNDSGWCFPSVAELARRCQLSDRGTQKILARLAAGGHIAVEANAGVRMTRGSPTHKYHLPAYQRSLTVGSQTANSPGGAQDEQLRSPLAAAKDERIGSPLGAEKGEQSARKGEQIDAKGEQIASPLAADKGERIDSPLGAAKGEQMARKGEQMARKGEQAGSPDSARSTNDPNTDPNTNNAPRARPAAPSDYQKVVKAYHDEIGTLTPIVEEEIKDELTRSSAEWVVRAIGIAAMRSHRRWAYVAGILRRWHADGFDGDWEHRTARAPSAAGAGSKAGSRPGSSTGSKSMGYGRQGTPAMCGREQSIEDYADDPEYYAQLKALYAGGSTAGNVAGSVAGSVAGGAAGAAAE